MGTIHRAFKQQLSGVPRLLLLKLVKEKLAQIGHADHLDFAEALTDHLIDGGGDEFSWNDGSSDLANHKIDISFSKEDLTRLNEITDEFFASLPSVIEKTIDDSAKSFLGTLKRNWPERAVYERNLVEGFRGRLEQRWGKGFGLLRMLLTSCREIGEEAATRLRKSRSRKNRVVRDVLIRLHARACQATAEIVTLIENGFADGAMARWRTLYEIGVVATVIAEAGESLAIRFMQHEVVESKFAMGEYDRCHGALGFKPISGRERRKIERAFAAVVVAHGENFGKPYGWAASYLKKKKVTFRDLEDVAQRSSMRSYYKMASYNVHADGPKGILFRLGVIGDRSVVVAGATDAGFTDPAQNAAITLVQITALLVSDQISDLDVMVMFKALCLIRDEIPETFMRADRKLKRDHKKLSGSANT